MVNKKIKSCGYERMRRRYGYLFVTHWVIGIVLFFAFPVINSIIYAFSEVSIEPTGVETVFSGLKYFDKIINEDPTYLNNLRDSLVQMLYSVPIILTLSMVLAIVLNQNFAGRTAFRALFFIPVIIVTSGLLGMMNTGDVRGGVYTVSSGAQYGYGSIIDFESILSSLKMPSAITAFISEYLSKVFNLVWDCGVQTVLLLAGLQSIPASFYEVSKIEGASKWEEFWFITIPMLKYVIPLVSIYTIIEFCVGSSSTVMAQGYEALKGLQEYSLSSAMMWFYFVFILAVMGLFLLIYNRFCLRKWE